MAQNHRIYTPVTMYKGFDPSQPLQDTVVSEEGVGDVLYREVYFNGRETEEGRVLIYGILAIHKEKKKRNAILIIPDYNSKPDINVINLYASQGYDVLMFDYKGECDDEENYTNYPSDIKYANIKYAERYLEYADEDAHKTCWYEWCCVARYAVSFIEKRLESNKIGVIGIKNGANIMWHLVSCDKRVTCAVALFGAGWQAYKHLRKYSGEGKFKIDDERIRFVAGVDAHSYAPYCRCPVALFTATNCADFDADRAHDTMRRVNKDVDAFFCLSPRTKDQVNLNCTRNIDLFFGVYLNGQRIQLMREPTIELETLGEVVTLRVETSPDAKPKSIDIYVCENQVVPARRNWIKLEEVLKEDESVYTANYTLINGGGMVFAFAVVEYRNGITVSTPITSKKCPKTEVIKTNLLYFNAEGLGNFVSGVSEGDVIADALFYKRNPLELVKGPMGITGISSRSGLITYKLNENCVDIKPDSIFKLDVYCDSEISLKLGIATGAGTSCEQNYTITIDVPKGNVWQNVVVSLKDFKTDDGKSILDCNEIDYLSLTADGFFSINNVLLI